MILNLKALCYGEYGGGPMTDSIEATVTPIT